MTLVADFNSSVNVPFQRMRQLLIDGALQEGVVGANDLKVVQRGAGANMSVDVGAGFAWVQIDTGTRNGMGHVTNDAVANVTVTASNGTNPRIDQIILRWNDTSIPTGSGNVPTLAVLTGTATAGATLDNRTGAAALPNDCLRLADLLIPTSSTSVVTANIRDRRLWARGARTLITRTTPNYTSTGTALALVSATDLQPRIECSGVPIRCKVMAYMQTSGAAPAIHTFEWWQDGTKVAGSTRAEGNNNGATGIRYVQSAIWDFSYAPAAGSHLIGPAWAASTGTLTLFSDATEYTVLEIYEDLRQNANNT